MKNKLGKTGLALAAFFLLLHLGGGRAAAIPVSSELLLLVDVSGSVSGTEFNLQRGGYADAFNDPAIQALIAGNPGGIAASLLYWSGAAQQSVAVGWTHLFDAATSSAFAAAIAGSARPFFGNTAIQSALNFGFPLFAGNGFEGNRLIMDISGDGTDNNSPAALLPTGGRDNALAAGVTTINGLVIGGSAFVENHYLNNVIGGAGAQLFTAADFDDFNRAVRQKIFVEVRGEIPEPSTYIFLSSGLIGLALLRRYGRLNPR